MDFVPKTIFTSTSILSPYYIHNITKQLGRIRQSTQSVWRHLLFVWADLKYQKKQEQIQENV